MVGQAESKTEEDEKVGISKYKHSQLIGPRFGEELQLEDVLRVSRAHVDK
jgi:hypothetical protein